MKLSQGKAIGMGMVGVGALLFLLQSKEAQAQELAPSEELAPSITPYYTVLSIEPSPSVIAPSPTLAPTRSVFQAPIQSISDTVFDSPFSSFFINKIISGVGQTITGVTTGAETAVEAASAGGSLLPGLSLVLGLSPIHEYEAVTAVGKILMNVPILNFVVPIFDSLIGGDVQEIPEKYAILYGQVSDAGKQRLVKVRTEHPGLSEWDIYQIAKSAGFESVQEGGWMGPPDLPAIRGGGTGYLFGIYTPKELNFLNQIWSTIGIGGMPPQQLGEGAMPEMEIGGFSYTMGIGNEYLLIGAPPMPLPPTPTPSESDIEAFYRGISGG